MYVRARASTACGRDIQMYEISSQFCKQPERSQLNQAAKLPTRRILAGELYGSDWAWKCNSEILVAGCKLQQTQLIEFLNALKIVEMLHQANNLVGCMPEN